MTCTSAMATGLTSTRGNLLGQSHDCGHNWETLRVRLIVPRTGNRYLTTCGPNDDDLMPTLNEKGLAVVGFARPTPDFVPYPGNPERITEDELLRASNSARDYINTASENMTRFGTRGFMGGGSIGRMLVDTREGYLFEGANFIYGDSANHAIHGPMTDQVFASGNFFINSQLKVKAEEGIGAGYTRAKRAWKLLVDRQYDCCVMESSPFRGRENLPRYGAGITLPYFMSIFRDHGDLDPEKGRLSNYVPEERGQEVICCHGMVYYTKAAVICNVVENHTDLFSSMWMTFGQPCLSPFLPIYIGVHSVPEDITVKGNPVAQVFEDLRLALEYRPDYAEKIKHYWMIFEFQTIEQANKIEATARLSLEKGNVDGARSVLTEFVKNKWAEATLLGKQWVDTLKNLPLSA
jgi:hypothetical protein